jgi:hypothetical protein
MKTTKDSAENTELDQEEAALRAEAEQISPVTAEDATIPEEKSEAEERAAANGEKAPEKTKRTGSAKQPDATGAVQPDASKTTQKTAEDAKKPEAQAKAGDKTAETPYSKERARLDTSWKELRTEREKIARERDQLAQTQRQLAEQQQQRQTIAKKPEGPTAAEYDEIAKDFETEGKLGLARTAREKAAELRKQETAAGAQAGQRHERFTAEEVQTMQQQWQANLEKAGKENPELTQESSPLRARVAELLKTHQVLHQSGDGIVYAVALAKTELKAKRADELESKVGELEKEVQRLTGLTSLPSGGAAPGTAAAKFDELSLDDQEAALREEAAAAAR